MILKYRMPVQCLLNDVIYYESEDTDKLCHLTLQERIDIFLGEYKTEQYPHMIGKYVPEKIIDI